MVREAAVAAGRVDADALPIGRWRALGVMAGAVLLSMTTWFSASAVVPQVRAAWGLTTNQASLLTIAVQLGFVTGAVLSAALTLADVFPRSGLRRSTRGSCWRTGRASPSRSGLRRVSFSPGSIPSG